MFAYALAFNAPRLKSQIWLMKFAGFVCSSLNELNSNSISNSFPVCVSCLFSLFPFYFLSSGQHSPYLRCWRRCINSGRNSASCQTWLQILPHPPAIWMPSKPCSRTRNYQKIKRNLPRCTDTSTRL